MSSPAPTIAAATSTVLATTARYGQWHGRYSGEAHVSTERSYREGALTTAAVAQAERGGRRTELSYLEQTVGMGRVHVGRRRGGHVGLSDGEDEGEGQSDEEGEKEGASHGCVEQLSAAMYVCMERGLAPVNDRTRMELN